MPEPEWVCHGIFWIVHGTAWVLKAGFGVERQFFFNSLMQRIFFGSEPGTGWFSAISGGSCRLFDASPPLNKRTGRRQRRPSAAGAVHARDFRTSPSHQLQRCGLPGRLPISAQQAWRLTRPTMYGSNAIILLQIRNHLFCNGKRCSPSTIWRYCRFVLGLQWSLTYSSGKRRPSSATVGPVASRRSRPDRSLPVPAAVTISATLALAAAGEIVPCAPMVTFMARPRSRYLTMQVSASRRTDADTEVPYLVIPEDMLTAPGFEGIDGSPGDPGHCTLLFSLPDENRMGTQRMQIGVYCSRRPPGRKQPAP